MNDSIESYTYTVRELRELVVKHRIESADDLVLLCQVRAHHDLEAKAAQAEAAIKRQEEDQRIKGDI